MDTDNKESSFWAKFNRRARWLIINIAQLILVYDAVILGRNWAENILNFIVPMYLILNILAYLTEEVREKFRASGPAFGGGVNVLVDFSILLLFSAVGWYFLATVKFLGMLVNCAMYASDE